MTTSATWKAITERSAGYFQDGRKGLMIAEEDLQVIEAAFEEVAASRIWILAAVGYMHRHQRTNVSKGDSA